MIRFGASFLVAVIAAAMPLTALARDPGAGPSAHHEASRIIDAELAMTDALAQVNAITAQHPASLADSMRHELQMASALYAFRQAARQEQRLVFDLAGYKDVEDAVVPLLPGGFQSPIKDMIAGMQSLYILAGIDQYYLVNPHYMYVWSKAAPLNSLRAYYLEAQNRYGIDASYLAAINFIESKFGRNNGPSSAGALGPMQFEPGTWQEYGQGGNINDPHAAILAAARLLVHNGAPYDMRDAIWHYNNSFDYVDSVEFFARAYRSDPGWLERMYYWDTFG